MLHTYVYVLSIHILYSNSLPPLSQWSEIDSFVQSVNTVLVAQTETERVRDAMSRITSYSAVDMPGEFREVSTHTLTPSHPQTIKQSNNQTN